jgi:hypothetical protein
MTRRLSPETKKARATARLLYPRPKPYASIRRCHTRDCGECASCRMRARWAAGQMRRAANTRKYKDAWDVEQDLRLRQLGTVVDRHKVAEVLTREFGIARTAQAVSVRASRLGISLWPPGWSAWETGALFGITPATVEKRWIEPGLLPAEPCLRRAGNRFSRWRIPEAAIEAFIRETPWAYELRLMRPGHRLTRLAELVNRADPWVDRRVLADYLGVKPNATYRYVRMGFVPNPQFCVGKGGAGALRVRAADLPAIREAVEAMRLDGYERQHRCQSQSMQAA